MSARKPKPATLDYSVYDRKERLPHVGQSMQLGKQEYEVVALRLRVELRPVSDISDAQDDDD